MAAGSILIDLTLRTGNFETDTARASKALQKSLQEITESVKGVAAIFGVGLGVDAFVGLIEGSIEAQAHLDELSRKTGLTVEALGGLGLSAKQVGSNLDEAATLVTRLNRSIAEAASGSPKTAAAFTALGIDIKGISNAADPTATALGVLADKFASIQDGPQKTALAIRLFGRAGADLIPLLDQGAQKLQENAEYFKRYSGVSEDSAKAAHDFSAELAKLKVLQEGLGNALTNAVLPILSAVVAEFIHASEESDHFKTAGEALKTVLQSIVLVGALVVDTFRAVGEGIATAIAKGAAFAEALDRVKDVGVGLPTALQAGAKLVALAKDPTLAAEIKAINEAHWDQRATEVKRLQALLDQVMNPVDYTGLDHSHAPKGPGPGIPNPQAAANAAALLKKQLDGQIALIDAFGKQEAQGYAFANQVVELDYDQHLISLGQKFSEEDMLRKAANTQIVKSLEEKIADEQAYIVKLDALQKSTGGAQGEGGNADKSVAAAREGAVQKIKALEVEKTAAIQKGSQDAVIAHKKEGLSLEALANSYESFRATLATLKGDDATAGLIANAQKLKDAANLFAQLGGNHDTELADLKKQLDLQLQINLAQKDYSKLVDAQSNAEAQLALDDAAAGKGELQQLMDLGNLRKDYIATLQKQAEAAQKVAADNPDNAAAVKNARDLTLALKQAKDAADPLGKTLNDLFKNDFADNFAQFLDGTKSLKDAFRSFADSVIADLARIAAKNLATEIFGSGSGIFTSSGGSGNGFLGSLLGWLTGSGGTSGATAGAGAGDYGLWAGATGTNYVPKDMVAQIHEGEAIVPKAYNPAANGFPINAGQSKGSATNNISVNVQAVQGMSRATALQQGRDIADGIASAQRRNG